MANDRRQRVDALFNQACELSPAQRLEFLGDECGGDAALRREVESLLEYYTDGFLETGLEIRQYPPPFSTRMLGAGRRKLGRFVWGSVGPAPCTRHPVGTGLPPRSNGIP